MELWERQSGYILGMLGMHAPFSPQIPFTYENLLIVNSLVLDSDISETEFQTLPPTMGVILNKLSILF